MKPHDLSKLPLPPVAQIMPTRVEIPREFFDWNHPAARIVEEWFFNGIKDCSHFIPADGIDPNVALHHLGYVLRSFEPEHNHKIAAVAYMLAQWFDEVTVGSGDLRWRKPRP